MRFQLQKFVPIDRNHPIYEIIEGDQTILDVSVGADGSLKLRFTRRA